MRYFVDDREVRPGTIGPPVMNYRQHWRWEGHRSCRYRYVISVPEFIGLQAASLSQSRSSPHLGGTSRPP